MQTSPYLLRRLRTLSEAQADRARRQAQARKPATCKAEPDPGQEESAEPEE